MKKLAATLAPAALGAAILLVAAVLYLQGPSPDPNLHLVHGEYNASLPPNLLGGDGLVVQRGVERLGLAPVNASFTVISWHLPNNSSRAVYSENVTRQVGALRNSSLGNASGTLTYPSPFGPENNYTVQDLPYRFRLSYHVADLPATQTGELFSITYRFEPSPGLEASYRDWYDYEVRNFTGGEALAFSVQFRDGAGDLAFLLPLLSITDADGLEHYYGYYYLKADGAGLLVEAMYFTGFMDAPPYRLNLDMAWNTVRIENATGAPIERLRQGEDAYLRIMGGFRGQLGEAHLLGPNGNLVHVRYVEDAAEQVLALGLSGNFPPGNYSVELRELTLPGESGELLGSAGVELLYRVLANVSIADLEGRPRDSFLQGETVVVSFNTSLPTLFSYVVLVNSEGDEARRFEVNGAQEGNFTFQTSEYDPWGFWSASIYDARPDFFGEGVVEQHLMDTAQFYLEPLNRTSTAWVDGGPFTQGDAVTIGYHYYFDLRSSEPFSPTARLMRPDGTLAREWFLSHTAGELAYYTDRGTPTGGYTLQVVFTNSTGEHMQASAGFELLTNATPTPPPPSVPAWGQAEPPTRTLRLALLQVEDTKTAHAANASAFTQLADQLRQYFAEASYGHLTVGGDVAFLNGGAWKVLPQPMETYAGVGWDGQANALELARDALDGLWGEKLSSYDAILIVHAGQDQAVTYNEADVLSGSLTLQGTPAGELNVVLLSETDPFGVWAHELIHSMGCIDGNGGPYCQLPDLYPGERDVGRWGLMGGVEAVFGTGPDGRNSPPHPCSWTKMRLGWLQPFFVGRGDLGNYTLPALETSLYGGPVLVFSASDPNDERNLTFYVVEPRTANATRTAFEGVLRNYGEEWLVVYKVTVDAVYATTGNARGLLSDRMSIRVLDQDGPQDAVLTTSAGDEFYLDPLTGVSVRLWVVERSAGGVRMTVELGLRPPGAT